MARIAVVLVSILFSSTVLSPFSVLGQTLKAGCTSKTIFFLPFFIAEKKGFYTDEYSHVELILMGTPAISLQALIAGVVNGVAYSLIGGKPYKKLEDLRKEPSSEWAASKAAPRLPCSNT